jgi:hypothetical protein
VRPIRTALFGNLPSKRLQLDEIWSFVYAKQKNVARAKAAPKDAGDVWTWVAIDADTKLVASWRIGDRSGAIALAFVDDLLRGSPIGPRSPPSRRGARSPTSPPNAPSMAQLR